MDILTSPETYKLDPADAWKRIKIRSATPRFLARLQALARWREEMAQSRDVPRNRIVKDDVIMEISGQPPRTPQALDHIRGLSKGFHASSAGRSLWACLEAAEALPDSELPTLKRPPRSRQKTPPITELLKVLLKSRCQDAGVAPKLVASSSDIEEIARDDKAPVPALKGWRYELFGRDALDIKHGRLAMTASGSKIEIVEIESA
jgi:ribonuclease D